MSLDTDVVRQVAHLARLNIADDDIQEVMTDLNNVLQLAEKMNELDTESVKPLLNPLDSVQRLREDIVTESDNRAGFQQTAPSVEQGLYLVPRVVE